jgi:PAS domain S-box-containing protein
MIKKVKTRLLLREKAPDKSLKKDITERKRTEEALRESEEKFRNIFESANDCMIYLDKYGRILDANRKAVEVFGGSKKELLGKHFTRLGVFHPRDIPKLMTAFANILAGKEGIANICIKNKRGQRRFLECSSYPIKADGKIVGTMVIARDVTEKKKAEERIRRSEEKYRNLFENARDVIVAFDLKGNVTSINKAVTEYGFKEDEIIGKNMLKFVPKKYWPKLLQELAEIARGNPVEGEIELITPKGKKIAEYRSNPIRQGKKVVGFQTILRDVTERKRMEEKLKEYAEHLEEKVKERTRELEESQKQLLKSEKLAAIGEVATMVGHDLRNPLQSIENATYYLNNELLRLSPTIPIPQKVMEMLQVITDSVNYADRIIRDLQDFSAMKRPVLKKADVNAIVKETLSQVETPANVELITELGHLPKIKVDKDMIKRVFLNLALNGIQAMENGGTLKVSTKKTKGFVEVSFKDTGVGISRENIEKLFTPFFTTKAKGLGMGLAICKKFVDAHSGTIEVESEEGKGTTFTVRLPTQQENGGEKPDEG